jgi:hypothetical protein
MKILIEESRVNAESVRPTRARLRMAGAAAAVAATLLTSACAAGREAQTADQVPTQDGVNATVRNIALRGLSVEAPAADYYVAGSDIVVNLVLVNTGNTDDALTGITTSSATGWGSYASVGDAAQVQGAANSAALASASPSAAASSATTPDDSATPVTGRAGRRPGRTRSSAASTTAPVPTASKNVAIPAGERVSYGVPDATGELLLTGTTGRLYPGNSVTLDFTFAHAGDIKVIVPIQLSGNPGEASISAPATEGGE